MPQPWRPPLHTVPKLLKSILASGGDHRLVLDAQGLTPYRVAMEPLDVVPLGSCTASSPGPRAYAGAEALVGAIHQECSLDELAASLRARLCAVLGVEHPCSVALTPSGTDVLYLVDRVVRRGAERVHHVIVGAGELGGGTFRAALGQTFSTLTPHGGPVEPGQRIDGLGESSAEAVYLRAPDGRTLPIEVVDAAVAEAVGRASGPNTRVVVHLVAHSKTGLRAPSMRMCERLHAEHGVEVMVDAAQGRVAPADVCKALSAGFLVLFTGSKFYSGPPFSGALLMPAELAGDPGPLPSSLNAWFDKASLPEGWTTARASLETLGNPGLLARWAGALAEIEAYHAIPPRWRGRVYATFAGAVHEMFGPGEDFELEFPIPPVHELATALGAFPTVFGFRVRVEGEWADVDALRRIHAALDTPHRMFRRYHLGQPVALGPPDGPSPALLRVALGARLVTDFARTPDAGGAWMRSCMGEIRSRILEVVR